MTFTVEAIYEKGTLKLSQPLPLREQEKVQVTIQAAPDVQARVDAVRNSYGLLQWKGDPQELERIALDDEFGILESP